MWKTRLVGALGVLAALALPLGAESDSGHGEEPASASDAGHSHAGGGPEAVRPASLAGAWEALVSARDAIAGDVERGELSGIHAEAEPLPELAGAVLARSDDLEAGRRARVEGAVKQVARVADALHDAADRGDAARTRKELARLDGLLALIRAQYPAGALETSASHGHEGHSAAPGQGGGAHAHMERPAGAVDAVPQATLRVRAFDSFRFEPSRLLVQAGVPTRIELENDGAVEHSLVVKTPDGGRDWIHVHAMPGATEAMTYRLDEPGTYPVRCTVPGHTEGGMVGEMVVSAGPRVEP
jgi:uncharacterized cupredoxin-like copper-binding protein